MKRTIITIVISLLFAGTGLQAQHTEQFGSFWTLFQQAVDRHDVSAVADLTHFPVRLVKYTDDGPKEILLNRAEFEKMYNELFGSKTKDMIVKTKADELLKRSIDPDKAIKEGVPGAKEVYYFNIPFEDREKQKANLFYFLKGEGKVRIFILLAAPVKDNSRANPSTKEDHSTK